MEDQLITFETAKTAKEKGFEINSAGSYDLTNGVKLKMNHVVGHPNCIDTCSVPTQSLLQKWLREKHNITIWFEDWYSKYSVHVNQKDETMFMPNKAIGTYEEALEVGLQESLKLIES